MVSKTLVFDMVDKFAEIYNKKPSISLKDSWFITLKPYSDDQLREAGYVALQKCKYMPKPSDVISFMASLAVLHLCRAKSCACSIVMICLPVWTSVLSSSLWLRVLSPMAS